MREANQRRSLALVISLLLTGGPASALVGADVADRTVQRFTVVVAGAKGRCSGVALAAHYDWIRETMGKLAGP